jgi:hypothetical protein
MHEIPLLRAGGAGNGVALQQPRYDLRNQPVRMLVRTVLRSPQSVHDVEHCAATAACPRRFLAESVPAIGFDLSK